MRASRQVAKLVRSLQVLWPEVAEADVAEPVQAAMLAHLRIIEESEDRVDLPYLPVPAPDGIALYMPADSSRLHDTAVRMRCIAEYWPGAEHRSALVPFVLPICVILHRGGREAGGSEWIRDRLEEWGPPSEFWVGGAELDQLVSVALEAMRLYDPSPAVADPAGVRTDALVAYEHGRLLRHDGEYTAAILAFREAKCLARRAQDWDMVVRAELAVGVTYKRRGNYRSARRHLLSARRLARAHELPKVEAMAKHDLFSLAVETGKEEIALRLAQQAADAYPPDCRAELARLAHDVADFWITRGAFRAALPVLQAAAPLFAGTPEYTVLSGSMARAAGGAGSRGMYHAAVKWLKDAEESEFTSRALLDAGRGAAMLRMWGVAHRFATAALAVAVRRREALQMFEAEVLLESAGREEAAEMAVARKESERDLSLSCQLTTQLRRCRPPAIAA